MTALKKLGHEREALLYKTLTMTLAADGSMS